MIKLGQSYNKRGSPRMCVVLSTGKRQNLAHPLLTAFQVWSQIWDHSSIHSQVFGHISANICSQSKNKSVLETLSYAEATGTTLSTVVNARHFDRGDQSSSSFSSIIVFFARVLFPCYFSFHISDLNFRKDTFSNANSYFSQAKLLPFSPECFTWKAVNTK